MLFLKIKIKFSIHNSSIFTNYNVIRYIFFRNSIVTTAPETITTLSPTVTPGFIIALPPIHTLFPKVIGFANSLPELHLVGLSGCVAV